MTNIQKEKDYSKFKLVKNNRPITTGKVKSLKDSINQIGYIMSQPVSVSSKMEIIDGQHRFEACRQLGLPIYYVIVKGDNDDIMINLNKSQSAWSVRDYINHLAEGGDKDYIELRDFIQMTGMSLSPALDIYSGGIGAQASKIIRRGDKLKRSKWADVIFLEMEFYKGVSYFMKKTKFVQGLALFISKANGAQWAIDKLRKNARGIIECATGEQYVEQFTAIVNKGQSKNRI